MDIKRLKIEQTVTIYSKRILIRLHVSVLKPLSCTQHFSLNRYSSTNKYASFVFFTCMYSNVLLTDAQRQLVCCTKQTTNKLIARQMTNCILVVLFIQFCLHTAMCKCSNNLTTIKHSLPLNLLIKISWRVPYIEQNLTFSIFIFWRARVFQRILFIVIFFFSLLFTAVFVISRL